MFGVCAGSRFSSLEVADAKDADAFRTTCDLALHIAQSTDAYVTIPHEIFQNCYR